MEKHPLQYPEVDEVLISDHSDFGIVDVNHAIGFLPFFLHVVLSVLQS